MAKKLVTLSLFILLFFFGNTVQASTDVVINEAMAEPDGEGEWVELYFPSSSFELAGYYFKDAKDNKKSIQDVQNCGNFAVFELSPTTYWLNNDTSTDKESIILYDQSGTEIDSRKGWENPGKGKTIGRTPDGADNWNETESPTKCAANSGAKPAESQVANQNSQNPSPTPSLSTNKSSASPKASPKPSPNTNKSPSPKGTTSPTVLGEKEGSSSGPIALQVNSQLSPTPTPQTSEKQPSKIAGISITAGAVLILISFGAFLWYKWEIRKPQGKEEGTD